MPGVFAQPKWGDDTRLSIRGSGLSRNFHLRGLELYMDAIPINTADGFGDFQEIDPTAYRYIEVYKGANALRFGGYTLGGAINYVSKTGYDAGLIELRSEAGSFGFLKSYVGTGQVYGPFDLYVGLSDTELDGFRQHGEQVRRRAFASFGAQLSGGTSVRLDLGYVRSDENLPGALTQQEMDRNLRQRNPVNAPFEEGRDYDYTRGALTIRS